MLSAEKWPGLCRAIELSDIGIVLRIVFLGKVAPTRKTGGSGRGL